MDCRTCPNLVTMFFDQAKRLGDKPFLWAKSGDAWQPTSWNQARERIAALARGLKALGLARGDRVGLVAENRPEWVVADLAILAAGGVTVPAYTTNTSDDHRHILADSGARFVIVSSAALAQRLLPAVEQCSSVVCVIAIEQPHPGQLSNADVHLWDDVLPRRLAGPVEPGRARRRGAAPARHRLPDLHLGHGRRAQGGDDDARQHPGQLQLRAMRLLETIGLGDEVFLSFLPLCMLYEHTGGMMFPDRAGRRRSIFALAEKVEALASNMLEVRPTIMTAVPRLYETMHQRILRTASSARPASRANASTAARRIGRKRIEQPHGLTFGERITNTLLDRLVRNKIRARFGGRLEGARPGGALLNPEIGMFFLALGVPLLQGYRPDRGCLAGGKRQPAQPHQDPHGRPALGGRRGQDRRGWRAAGAR